MQVPWCCVRERGWRDPIGARCVSYLVLFLVDGVLQMPGLALESAVGEEAELGSFDPYGQTDLEPVEAGVDEQTLHIDGTDVDEVGDEEVEEVRSAHGDEELADLHADHDRTDQQLLTQVGTE